MACRRVAITDVKASHKRSCIQRLNQHWQQMNPSVKITKQTIENELTTRRK
jgi:uncharacterized protein YbdZ (MbtH family)